MTDEQNTIVVDVPDYTPYLTSIEERLENIEKSIQDFQEVNHSDMESLRTESIFMSEGLQTFVPYANTADIANLLFGVIIMLGLIFGALVFRHFRK